MRSSAWTNNLTRVRHVTCECVLTHTNEINLDERQRLNYQFDDGEGVSDITCTCGYDMLHLNESRCIWMSHVQRKACANEADLDAWPQQTCMYSLLHSDRHFFIFKSQSMIAFSGSLLLRSVEKRPRRLRLETEIKSHSKRNRLYIRIMSHGTYEWGWPRCMVSENVYVYAHHESSEYGVATMSRMLKNIGLFCKRALQKRPVFCKETCIFKHPTHRSHPIPRSRVILLQTASFRLMWMNHGTYEWGRPQCMAPEDMYVYAHHESSEYHDHESDCYTLSPVLYEWIMARTNEAGLDACMCIRIMSHPSTTIMSQITTDCVMSDTNESLFIWMSHVSHARVTSYSPVSLIHHESWPTQSHPPWNIQVTRHLKLNTNSMMTNSIYCDSFRMTHLMRLALLIRDMTYWYVTWLIDTWHDL